MIRCKVEDEHNEKFKMALSVELCAMPYIGIDSAHVWLTVRYVGE